MKLALEGTDQGLWEWDINTRKVVYDENWQRIMNLPVEGRYVDTEQWLARMDAGGRAEFEIKMTDYLAGRVKYYEFEHRLQTGNNEWKWIWTRGITSERDPSGIPLKMIGTYRDITKLKQQEVAVQEGRERYRTLIENTGDLIYALDKKGFLTYMNPALERTLGYAHQEWNGKTFLQITAPEYIDSMRDMFKRAMKGESISDYSVDLIRKDETRLSVEFNVTTTYDSDGKPAGRYGIGRDVTVRKRTEIELSKSEERFRTIFKVAAEGILIVDKDERSILYANAAICDLLGYTESEILQLVIDDLHPAEVRPDIISTFESIKTKPSNHIGNLPYLCKNGTIVYGNVNSSEMEIDGKTAIVGFITDVTARKRIEDSLKLSEANYRQLYDSSPVGIYQLDYRTGKFTKANDAMCKYLGCSQEEITALNPYDIMTDESKQLFSERLTKIGLGEKVSANPEFEIVDKKGKRTAVQLNINHICNAEGLVIGADVVAHDVTERKQAEIQREADANALKESEEKFRRITENMSDFVVELDAQGIVKYVSPSSEKVFGKNVFNYTG
ncbi:MAG: PAS domain S-box protein, partial [Methanomicrobiales archaeon]